VKFLFSISYFGYAAVLVLLEKHILFDPGIIRGAPLVNNRNIQTSYILVSQASIEHLGNANAFPTKQGSIILASKQVFDALIKQGVLGYSVEQIADQQIIELGANISVIGYNLPRGGFLAPQNFAFFVKSDQGSVLHLGHAKEIGTLSGTKPDLLCISVAGKKKGTFDPESAIVATLNIQPRYVLPICGSEQQTHQYISLLKEKESGVIPISISAGESFTLV
jgi:L-ascorbate metabolism protein UlaG (beta-lactamase superfamily)